MELIDQHTKRIMEGCKKRAREVGLKFHDETLEYVVTNRDLIDLGPKSMIPTLYDYWVHDVEVLRERGRYELYPENPYETVINTRPAISFYNDNNPDWLNVMIFYHVLAHIDFFQSNLLFKHTWDEDFAGQALSDKRTIAMLRSEKGRWVDYVIEFTRGIDNLVGFFGELSKLNRPGEIKASSRLDYYFDVFLQSDRQAKLHEYLKEIDRFNEAVHQYGDVAEAVFLAEVTRRYPEFEALYQKYRKRKKHGTRDLIQYIQEHSPFLRKEENRWMKTVMQIVRKTSLFLQPQIRTKILNEGWASYWHERLFLQDDRIKGNEVGFARVNALVTALPRIGINPYALGMRLFSHIEELADRGKFTYEFQKIRDTRHRRSFDSRTGAGMNAVFDVRENFSDFTFLNTFVDQDFVDRHQLFVVGKRLNQARGVWEYYVRSRNADKYKQMLLNSLYHPPHVEVDEAKTGDECLYLTHTFEEKPLVREFIENTMIGISYLWGGTVKLETSELVPGNREPTPYTLPDASDENHEPSYQRVLFSLENRKLSKAVL